MNRFKSALNALSSNSRYFSSNVNVKLQTHSNEPLAVNDPFKLNDICSVHDLFLSRCHYGHKSSLRNPYMSDYLFGTRQQVDIFDLHQTRKHLILALNFIAHIANRNGIILFFSTDKMIMPLIERTAKECGEFSFCREWTGSPFLNAKYYYKEQIRLPDLVIAFNTLNPLSGQHEIIKEASKILIPTIGIVDSNCDPRLISYPIPGNDDSVNSIQLYCSLFKEAIIRGKNYVA